MECNIAGCKEEASHMASGWPMCKKHAVAWAKSELVR